MLTWLDGYVKDMAQVYRDIDLQLMAMGRLPRVRLDRGATDFELVQAMTRLDYEQLPVLEANLPLSSNPQVLRANLARERVVAPFLFPVRGYEPLAIQVSPELAEDFYGAKAPAVDDWKDLVRRHKIVYLDLPPDVYRVQAIDQQSQKPFYLRAVFIEHLVHRGEEIFEVFTEQALEGTSHLDYQIEMSYAMGQTVEWDLVEFGKVADMHEAQLGDLAAYRESLDDLIQLTLLYYLSSDRQVSVLPRLGPHQYAALRSDKKRNAKLKSHSLFNVVRLGSPAHRFERPPEDREVRPKEGYQLVFRRRIRGHFYWQAYDKGWQKHRLRWRKGSVQGPPDAPFKQTMYQLGPKPRPDE